MSNFTKINWQEPLDVNKWVASIPKESKVKGMLFQSVLRESGQFARCAHYGTLATYPSTELATVLVQSAKLVAPRAPMREALRQLGQRVFPAMRSHNLTSLLFNIAGRSPQSAFKLVGRAYQLLSSNVSVSVHQDAENNYIIELRNVWTFADSYHVGIFEGALEYYSAKAKITICRHTTCDVDLKVTLL